MYALTQAFKLGLPRSSTVLIGSLRVIPARYYSAVPQENPPKKKKRELPGTEVQIVNEPPKIDTRTWFERLKDNCNEYLDYDKHLQRRRLLAEKITESYWKDFIDLNTGSKKYEAPNKLVKAEKAMYMPNFRGKNLAKQRVDSMTLIGGKTSLVTFCFTRFGEAHVSSYVEPWLKEFGAKNPNMGLLEMNIQENPLKGLILRVSQPNLRRLIPKERHETYVMYYKDIEMIRRRLSISNAVLGWSFLVDSNHKVRWSAHGIATPAEIDALLSLAKELDKENKHKKSVKKL
ncbi:hypothetical protein K7432_007618 [Basidiobolus ranarum]|uniref:Mitochondrial ATPase complex subunit ATP10 n=1 Tax=Basidiobolus ranarum TaxID=34480 RepID=A0ABR2WTB2_9FUNG